MVFIIKKLKLRPKARTPGYFIVEKFKGVTALNLPEQNLPFNPYKEASMRNYAQKKFGNGQYIFEALGGDQIRYKQYFKGVV